MLSGLRYDDGKMPLIKDFRSVGIPIGGFSIKKPIVTLALIIANTLMYVVTSYENFFIEISDYWISLGGFVPSLIETPLQWYRILTSMFLHADLFHIFFNMYFLYLFGRAVENALGKSRFLILYLASGIIASVFHTAFSFMGGLTAYVIPAIGASGAISGVLGAYLIFYPGTYLLAGFGFPFPMFFRVKASYYLIFWFATQVFYGFTKTGGSTAVFAHAGGFVAGIALLPILVDKEKIAQFRIFRLFSMIPYLMPARLKTRGLGYVSKMVLVTLLIPLVGGAVYALLIPPTYENTRLAVIQYNCNGFPYVDYIGVQLPDLESQIASISLDTTRILLNRLKAARLLYNEENSNEEIFLENWSSQLPVKIRIESTVKVLNVTTTIHSFSGSYDAEGFLTYGEGRLTTRAINIFLYGQRYLLAEGSLLEYGFKITSIAVNPTTLTKYTGALSLPIVFGAMLTVVCKDKDLTLIEEV
ncbi:MAG: rhomboid family intramembrane serine protease [Candidatus Brockarchaeota archaeon]|nr:rhomboid family intramembrane serine protease [Candidatus Brockarchaeota archaeon]